MATRSVQPECYLNTHVGSVEGTVLVAKLSVGRRNSTAFEILRRSGPGHMAVGGCGLGAERYQKIDFWASRRAVLSC